MNTQHDKNLYTTLKATIRGKFIDWVSTLGNQKEPGVVMYTFNTSTQPQAEAGRSLCFQSQPGLHCKFQASQIYMVIFCLRGKN